MPAGFSLQFRSAVRLLLMFRMDCWVGGMIGCVSLVACANLDSSGAARAGGRSPIGHPAVNAARLASTSPSAGGKLETARVSRSFQRQHPTTPFYVQRIRLGSQADVHTMLELQDDHFQRFRGMRRVGDGIVSVGIQNGRGRWLEGYECGGHLFVVAPADQTYRVVVRNESRCRLEIVAGMDERDLITRGSYDYANAGAVLAPMQSVVFGDRRAGRQPLRSAPAPVPTQPVLQMSDVPQVGAMLIAVFHEKDRFPWEGSSRPMRRNTSGTFPQPRYEAEPLPHDYR